MQGEQHIEAHHRASRTSSRRRAQRRPDRGDPGRRHRGRLPRRAPRDQPRDHHRARGQPREARTRRRTPGLRGPAAPRRRPRPRRRHGHTDGLSRGTEVIDTGGPITVPVGDMTLGRIFNLLGEPIDQAGDVEVGERWPIHRPAPTRREPDADDGDVRDRHQGHRPARALRQGRQGRPVRRRRRRQDGPHPGAHPQPGQGARRPVGVLRRGRALARGQRPLARDEGVGRPRQDDARLRPDERAARRAHARRAVRPDDGGVLPRAGPGRAAVHRQHLPVRPGRLGGLRAPGPHAVAGRLPADARVRDGPAAGAHHLDAPGLGHLGAGDLRPGGRPHRPGAGVGVRAPQRDDDAVARRSPRRASTRRSTRSTRRRRSSRPTSSARSTSASPTRSRRSSSATASCRTSSRSSASTSCPTRTS